jgi:mono/diheme cytochrome c family protein
MPRAWRYGLPVLVWIWLLASAIAVDAQQTSNDPTLIAKGEYLARAGDCIACHTAREGKTFAGVEHHAGCTDRDRYLDG